MLETARADVEWINRDFELPRVLFRINGGGRFVVQVPDGKAKSDLVSPYQSLTRDAHTGEPVRLHFRGFTADVIGRFML